MRLSEEEEGAEAMYREHMLCTYVLATVGTYHHGISLIGMKKPAVNPVTEAMMGERRNAFFGNARIIHIRKAIQT